MSISSSLQKMFQQKEKSAVCFITREINPWVISPGLIALFGFFVMLWHILTFEQSSIALIALIFFGTIAFPMLLSPLYTTIKITKGRIDWTVFGKFGAVIYLDELREIRVHHRLFVKLNTGRWWNPTMCPANRNGFLMAIREARPNLAIKGWKFPHKS